jgi:hypothetical protein
VFEPAALYPLAFAHPLKESLPFHPQVRRCAHLHKHGVAVITPAFADQLSLLQAIHPDTLKHETYQRAYRQTLNCVGVEEPKQISNPAVSKQPMHSSPPLAADAVFALLERQWVHLSSCTSTPLPSKSATENCQYLRDLSSVYDVRSAHQRRAFSFFPTLDKQLASLQERMTANVQAPSFEDATIVPMDVGDHTPTSQADGGAAPSSAVEAAAAEVAAAEHYGRK